VTGGAYESRKQKYRTDRKTIMRLTSILLSTAFVIAGSALAGETRAADISGAGATFPYPIYAKWADA